MRSARTLLLVWTIVAGVVPVSAGTAPEPKVAPGVLEATAPLDVMVRFERTVPEQVSAIPGLQVLYRFGTVPGLLAHATPSAARALAELPGLAYLEPDGTIELDLDSATAASRAKEVWGGPAPVVVGGKIVDGAGVGIAIVDTGLDGLHPDFAGRIGGNYHMTPAGPVPADPYTSNPQSVSAHGTHVAGIAGGDGALSGGTYRGVAPGATLYSFQMNVGTLSLAAIAFDWIHQHGAEQTPPIRVVNNSWHCSIDSCGHPLNSERMHYTLATAMARDGITVTWSAGNTRGDGDMATTNPEATNPEPGIIGVANYKDETGRRDVCLSSSSAWGSSADPSTWPDLSAPGRSVISTWAIGYHSSSSGFRIGRNPVTNEDAYYELTGTSMAAPHVAGIAALMLQANPALTPDDIEYIVKDTSTVLTGPVGEPGCGIGYVRADRGHPWSGANYAAGHGLVDARSAVEEAIAFGGIPPAVDVEPIPDEFIVSRTGIAVDRTFYLTGEDQLTETYPDAPAPRLRPMAADGEIVHTSAPFTEPVTADAITIDVFLGTNSEQGDAAGGWLGRSFYLADVEHIDAGGEVTLLAQRDTPSMPVRTLSPIHRDFRALLDEPVTFDEGDRLRVRVWALIFPWQGVEPPVNGIWALYSESFTPTRVGLGTQIIRPAAGTREACERRLDCAMVDATHPYEGLVCDEGVPVRISWTGPVGSALIYNCDGVHHVCAVQGEPGETGTCTQDVLVGPPTRDHGAFCTYRLPDGSRGGWGMCEAIEPIPQA